MDVLPFTCPRHGHEFKKLEPRDHRCPYACPCGEVVLTTTTLMYLDPDPGGTRGRAMLDMIEEAWDSGTMSVYINSVDLGHRLGHDLGHHERASRWWHRPVTSLRSFWRGLRSP